MQQTPSTNVPQFSVSELAFSLKKTLESTYGRVRVRGELSRVKIHTSGHMYSAIKDDNACIDAVCWRGNLSRLSVKPEEGLEVICTGRISTYPARSNYQIIIDSMELAGEGALLKLLEERKKRLASEGLFESSRKKNIPFLPERIGVITSPTGAVIRDIMHRLNDRFPRHVLLWPVQVQGENAADRITEAVKGFDSLPGSLKPDVLIVARGGGSLEDLMPFNEENVVRAIAACRIPVITAVGHETDTTLVDYAADLRAPTPTGAAEMAVPRRMDLLATVRSYAENLLRVTGKLVSDREGRIETLAAKLGDPSRLLEIKTQRLDHTGYRMEAFFSNRINLGREKVGLFYARLRSPGDKLSDNATRLDSLAERLAGTEQRITSEPLRKLEYISRMLENLSFKNVLQRGFVLVRDKNGNLLPDAEMVTPGQELELEFRNNRALPVTARRKARQSPEKAQDNRIV